MTILSTMTQFERFRVWLLNPLPDTEPSPTNRPDPAGNFDKISVLEQFDNHDWIGEAALTDLGAYSEHRAARIIRHELSAPASLHRLNITQIFQAQDHGIHAVEDLYLLGNIEKLLRGGANDELRDLYGEYLVRYPENLVNLARNRDFLANSFAKTGIKQQTLASIHEFDGYLNAAVTARERLFRGQLAALLSPVEYADTATLSVDILQALYPAIWTDGLSMHQAQLRATPMGFQHYTWNAATERWHFNF